MKEADMPNRFQQSLLLAAASLAIQNNVQAAADQPDVAARYVTTVCAHPCQTPEFRQWLFWRGADRVEIRDGANALGELWKRDAHGRVSYTYLEPAHKRGIEYTATDLKIIDHRRPWPALAGIVAPAELDKLAPAGEAEVLGRRALVYRGRLGNGQLEVLWLPDLKLAARVTHTATDRRTVHELQAFLTDQDALSATTDAQLAEYRLVDFADLGDMEASPGMAWLKQVVAAPGHPAHDH
jgi:hypothetical protein